MSEQHKRMIVRALLYGLAIGLVYYFSEEKLHEYGVLPHVSGGVLGWIFGILAALTALFPEVVAAMYVLTISLVGLAWLVGAPQTNGEPIDALRFWCITFLMSPMIIPFLAKLAGGGYWDLFRKRQKTLTMKDGSLHY